MDSIEEVPTHKSPPTEKKKQPTTPERDSRSEVVESYNAVYESLKNEDTSNLSPEKQAERKAEVGLVERIKQETLDKDKKFVTKTVTDRTGNQVKFTESPPVRPLLEHITRVLENPAVDDTTKEQFKKYRELLYRNSRLRAYSPSQMEARIDQELVFLENNQDFSTGDTELNNRIASQLFAFRFDLILPKKEQSPIKQPEPLITDQPIVKNPNRLKPQHNADGSIYENGAGEIPAHMIEEYLGDEPIPVAAEAPTVSVRSEFPDGAGEIASTQLQEFLGEENAPKPETAGTIQSENENTIPTLTWKNHEYDEPVQITGYLGTDTNGREYVSVAGSNTGIPLDEIDAPDEIKDRIRKLQETPGKEEGQTSPEEQPAESTHSLEEIADEEMSLTPETTEQIRREVYILNRNVDLRKRAAELAEKHLRIEQRRGKLWNPLTWARKSKLRILEEYYRQKFMKEASEKILEANNTYLSMDVFKNAAVDATHEADKERKAGKAKIDQLKTGELTEGQKVTEVTGEIKTLLLNDLILNNGVTTENMQEKLRDFVATHQEDPSIKELFGADATRYGELAKYFATDLLETRKLINEDLEAHRYANDRIADFVNVKLANVNWAADTEVQWTLADKAIAWSQRNNKRGFLTNPAVVGAATAIGLYGGMRAAGYSGKALIAAPLVGTFIGAAFSAVRRAHDLKVDRASHQVEMTYGDKIPEKDAKRRKSLEKFKLETTSVNTLLNGGNERTTIGGDTRGIKELLNLDVSAENPNSIQNREALLRRVAEIRTRLDYSTSKKVDLITYESRETVEQGRLQLIKAVVEAKQKLINGGMDKDQIDSSLDQFYGEWSRQFLTDREKQDKAFNRYRVNQSLITAGIGGASGLLVGLGISTGIREAVEHLDGHAYIPGVDKVPGLNHLTGKPNNVHEHMQALSADNKPTKIGDITLTTDASHHIITTAPNGTSELHQNWTLDPSGHIKVDGQVPPNMQDQFKSAGFDIQSHVEKQPFTFDSKAPLDQDDLPGLHHNVNVPHGTGWVHADTNDPNKWNLVVNQHPDQILIKDAVVTPDGQSITFNTDLKLSPLADTFSNSRVVELSGARIDHKDVFGPQGLWSKESTPIDHREWYGNNTNYSDLNELRVYNSVFTTGGQKGIDWDMSHMTPDGSFQTGNHPDIINAQETISHGHAALAFSTPDHQQDPIIITDASDGVIDGHFRLDPNDFTHHIGGADHPESMTVGEFSRMVVDQQKLSQFPDGSLASELNNHQDLFTLGKDGKPGFIEAGRLTEINGKTVFQPFATAQGTGNAPLSIDVPVPPKMDTVIDFQPKPVEFDHTITELIPPSDHEIPIIPWVITPRFPLERLTPAEVIAPPYYPYVYNPIAGGAVGLDEKGRPIRKRRSDGTAVYEVPIVDTEKWLSERSERLKADPNTKLDQQLEIQDYFNRMNENRRQRIERLTQQIEQPMNTDVRGAICIPVAAALEADNVEGTLSLLAQQSSVANNQYEVIVYLNWMNGADMDKVKQTQNIVGNFKTNNPNFPLKIVNEELPRDTFTIGDVMKTVNDVALKRIQNANLEKDVMVTVLPADVKGLSRRFIEGLIANADGSKDIYTSPIEFGTMYYKDYPGFHMAMRALENIIRISEQAYPAPIFTAGSGLQKKASMLAAIGGYDETLKVGEDADMGMRAVAARLHGRTEYTKEEFPVGRSFLTWNEVDPARLLQRYRNGETVLAAWNDFTEGGYKARPISPDSVNESIETEWPLIIERLESQLTSLSASYTPSLTDRAFNLALGFTEKSDGAKIPNWIRNTDGTIRLTDAGKTKLRTALSEYRDKKLYNTRYRPFSNSGNPSRGIKPDMSDVIIEDLPRTPGERITTALESSTEISREPKAFLAGTSETQGLRREMEDAHVIIDNFTGKSDRLFAGVYDGHGGKEAAKIASETLHEALSVNLNNGQTPEEALKNAFFQTDRQIDSTTTAGSTAITAFINNNELFVANVGDARAVLSGSGIAKRLSHDHKADDAEEEARIKSMGGIVTKLGTPRVMGKLAVARALGDRDDKPYLIPDPYISKTELTENDDFLILACDGVWDVIYDQEAVNLIQDEKDPNRASELLMNKALEKGSRDNITATVIRLNHRT